MMNTAPDDLDEEELATYAEEYDLHLEDVGDDLWTLSDLDAVSEHGDELEEQPPLFSHLKGKQVDREADADVDMDL